MVKTSATVRNNMERKIVNGYINDLFAKDMKMGKNI